MLRRTSIALGVSPYAVFLSSLKGNNLHMKGLTFQEYKSKASDMWKNLSVEEKAEFAEKAKAQTFQKKQRTGYQLFMKAFGLTGPTVGSKWDLLRESERHFFNDQAAKGVTRISAAQLKKAGLKAAPPKKRVKTPSAWDNFFKQNSGELKGLSATDRAAKMKELAARYKAHKLSQ